MVNFFSIHPWNPSESYCRKSKTKKQLFRNSSWKTKWYKAGWGSPSTTTVSSSNSTNKICSCEKDKIRQWQRNKEVHALEFYETFHLSEHYFDEDSVSDSYSDSDFDLDYYNEEISMYANIVPRQLDWLVRWSMWTMPFVYCQMIVWDS